MIAIVEGDAARALMAAADAKAFPGWDDHPLSGAFARRLYRQVHTSGHDEHPFVGTVDGAAVALVPATVEAGMVSMLGLPLPLALRADLTEPVRRKVMAAAFQHLAGLGGRVLLKGGEAGDLGPTDRAAIDRQGAPQASVWAVVDLGASEEDLRRDLRGSFRSLVNWGRRSLEQVFVADRDAFDVFPDFHARIAGRVVRGPGYWQAIWDEIACGRAELALARLDGELVAVTLAVDAGETCYYASGVYDRERFDKPISHWPVLSAMLRAKARGLRYFDLGELPGKGCASNKEVAIGTFKKGFTARYRVRLAWEVALG